MKLFDITSSIPASNYSMSRQYYPEGICYHITGDSSREVTVSWFRNPSSKVSAHYVIEKNGDTFLCVHPESKAYHCGIVNKATAQIYYDKGELNPNNYLIGIECVSNGEPLTTEQLEALTTLTLDLCNTYKIPVDKYHLIGHNELDSVDRIFDPISSYKVDDVVHAVEILKIQGGKGMEENKVHWAQGVFDFLKSQGIEIHETRFDDKITRGEVFALLAQIIEKFNKK